MFNNRTHPELNWQVISSEHFNIHYHQGLEDMAQKTALIGEQIYQPIMDQLEVEDFGKTDIVISAEDEILNGFALPSNQIFIWAYQNDAAGWFLGSEKWLFQVLAHEFQHVVLMNALKDWLGIWNLFGVPGWFIEGCAEYYTETWRVGRSDGLLKVHTYKNTMKKLNPHDSGYAKLLFMADKYGDSTITKIVKHRKYVKIGERELFSLPYSFKRAFKKVTGQSLKDFDEEWRRAMNTYFYSYRGQKEAVESVGEPVVIPGIQTVVSLSFSPDSSLVAVVGRKNGSMQDWSLYTVTTDTTHRIRELHYGHFGSGRILASRPAWSPDGRFIVIAEFHRGRHGSLEWDVRVIDVERRKVRWLTEGARASDPVWSPDGRYILYVAHPGETTNLYLSDPEGENITRITSFSGDVQVQDPDWSPDGQSIVFAVQEEDGDMDIAVVAADGSGYRKLTRDAAEDLAPLFSSDGEYVIFTSFRNTTPNLYRLPVDDRPGDLGGGGSPESDNGRIAAEPVDSMAAASPLIQMTDVAEGIIPAQIMPRSGQVVALTLADVDTVRVRRLDPERRVENAAVVIRDEYARWRRGQPEIPVPEIDYRLEPTIEGPRPFRSWGTWRPLLRGVLPTSQGVLGLGVWNDALGKNIFQAAGTVGYDGTVNEALIGWLNARLPVFLSVTGYYNARLRIRGYGDGYLIEGMDGVELGLSYPFNLGHRLTANHTLGLLLRGFYRRPVEDFGVPESSALGGAPQDAIKEGGISLLYQWKSQRPHRGLTFLPNNGTGVQLRYDFYSSAIFGDADYSRVELDLYHHQRLGRTPLVIFGRAVWTALDGDPPPQDQIGLLTDPPVYLNPGSLGSFFEGIVETVELHSLRGLEESYLGEQVVSGTMELRLPIVEKPLAQVLGWGLGHFTLATFMDFGQVVGETDWITTAGMEIKADIVLGELPVLTLAFGQAGDREAWEQQDPIIYLRLGLVAPF